MAKNILRDYFFRITAVVPTAPVSTAFLKQVAIVVKPKTGVTSGTIAECDDMTDVAALTDNTEASALFSAGMARVTVIAKSDLDLESILDANGQEFFTLLVSSDFADADLSGLDLGSWKGVTGVASNTGSVAEAQAAIENRVGFFKATLTGSKNMFYAFGKLLASSLTWANQQYISMPNSDGVETLGAARANFNDRVSFVLSDKQYGNRLGLFAVGGKAIIAPYVERNLELDIQSAALTYVTANQPAYTVAQAALIQAECQKVIDGYVSRGLIESGSIDIRLEQSNFVASAYIVVPEAKGLWVIEAKVTQSAQ